MQNMSPQSTAAKAELNNREFWFSSGLEKNGQKENKNMLYEK